MHHAEVSGSTTKNAKSATKRFAIARAVAASSGGMTGLGPEK
jgi:hypothetical protein